MKNQWKKKAMSVITACLMLTAATQAVLPGKVSAAENLITNANFDTGTTDWGIYKESGGQGTLSTEDGKLALHITSLGTLNYSVQMFYDIIPLYQNGVYHLHYEISASEPRYVEGMIQQNGGTYQSYTWKGLDLTTTPTIVDYDFTMEAETDIMAKLVFNCGVAEGSNPAGEHTIYLDNVSLELVDDSKVDYSASKPYAPPIVAEQIGYRTNERKTAVVRADAGTDSFSVVSADTGETVYTGTLSEPVSNSSAEENDRIADFSEITTEGTYYISCGTLDDSYSFVISDNPYGKLLDDSIRMLYLQRCGCVVEDEDFGHPACHTGLAKIYGTDQTVDVSGGWHDAGDYGRYTVAAAKAVADLLYAYKANPELYSDSIGIPESGNGVPDILDEVRYELEWMLKMQDPVSGGVHHKVSCQSFPGYVMPQEETDPLIVTPVSSTATADFCASMALAAEIYSPEDEDFSNTCFAAAEAAWSYLEQNPNFQFTNPSDITTGDYGDKSDIDERFWAAAQMYRAGKTLQKGNVDAYSAKIGTTVVSGLDWSTVGDYGNLALASMPGDPLAEEALSRILRRADSFTTVIKNSPYGSPIVKYDWGSNMTIANAGVILGLAYQETGDAAYLEAAQSTLHYLLGMNPVAVCFVSGYGTVSPQNPHHRPSMAVGKAMPGMLAGGVNQNLEDSAAKAYCKNEPDAKCYVDNAESYSTNEITIYWNSPLTFLLALTESAAPAEVSGDVNNDGNTDIADAVLLQRYLLAEIQDLPNASAGDMNGDKKLTASDLTLLKRVLLK